ncbi:hypothetical protein HPB47_010141 [Ixodes persulcatus]|uniref:Uncharacterized protein n=1 Tax=Ixodes persulcatus TaxID=34615 RepID=A0AC60P050_IXOPE|nr:hypothetical protein HPB47_010141 [Ixodes persulcatus]
MHIVNFFLLTLQFLSGTAFGLRPGFMGANLSGTRDPTDLDGIPPFINVSCTANEDKRQATEAINFSIINQLHLGHSGTATSTPASSHWPRRPASSPWIVRGHGSTHTMHIVNFFLLTLQKSAVGGRVEVIQTEEPRSETGGTPSTGYSPTRQDTQKEIDRKPNEHVLPERRVTAMVTQAAILKRTNITETRIFTGSQEALPELRRTDTCNTTVAQIRKLVCQANDDQTITVAWLPGHEGVPGNDRANEAMRAQLQAKQPGPVPSLGPRKVPEDTADFDLSEVKRAERTALKARLASLPPPNPHRIPSGFLRREWWPSTFSQRGQCSCRSGFQDSTIRRIQATNSVRSRESGERILIRAEMKSLMPDKIGEKLWRLIARRKLTGGDHNGGAGGVCIHLINKRADIEVT